MSETLRGALAELIQDGIREFERQPEGCYITDEDMLKIVARLLVLVGDAGRFAEVPQ